MFFVRVRFVLESFHLATSGLILPAESKSTYVEFKPNYFPYLSKNLIINVLASKSLLSATPVLFSGVQRYAFVFQTTKFIFRELFPGKSTGLFIRETNPFL